MYKYVTVYKFFLHINIANADFRVSALEQHFVLIHTMFCDFVYCFSI